jgi:cobalt/nickel transport protein
MRRKLAAAAIFVGIVFVAASALGHFQVLLPSDDIVSAEDDKTVNLDLLFTHPMEQGPLMDMGNPVQFGVVVDGKKRDLKDTLKKKVIDGNATYSTDYQIKRPGDYVFYVEPAPYWEPAEQKMIIHYTKVVVDGFGAEEGWDQMVGFPVEIKPLVRPYGLWAGNVFRGVVMKNGKPVPNAEIEVEYWNKGGKVKAPESPFVTQVIKADENGVFSYAMPRAGWWGFAALVGADKKMANPDGKKVDVELGGLMWVRARDMK